MVVEQVVSGGGILGHGGDDDVVVETLERDRGGDVG